jgi:hypothetical protein
MIRFEILLPLFYNDGRPIEEKGAAEPRPVFLPREISYAGGKSPSSMSSCRRATRTGSFMAST